MAIEPFGARRQATAKRGAYPIPLTAETTTGFLGRTERGPINEPVLVESFPEYCRFFGKHFTDAAVSHAVQDYFLHGGRRAAIVRVVNRARRARIDVPAGDDMLRLEARNPGRHENVRVSIDYEQVDDDPWRFNLIVQRLGNHERRTVEDQEIYPLISVRESDDRFVGSMLANSRLVMLAGPVPALRPDATPPVRPGDPVRYLTITEAGDDGDELTDYDVIGSDRIGTGLFAFGRGPRIDLLAIPLLPERELGTTALVAASRYCETRRALLIRDPPASWQSADAALLGARRLEQANASMLTYFPRIRPRGTHARYVQGLPACGAIAGMLAQRGRRGHFGRDQDTDYFLRAALAPIVALTATEARRLARHGVNCFVQEQGSAPRLAGHVTLGASAYGAATGASLDACRLRFFILNSIEEAADSAVRMQEPSATLTRLEWQLRRFFEDLYLHGALQGRTPGEAYRLEIQPATDSHTAALRFGFAIERPGRFAEYQLRLVPGDPIRCERVRGLEAEQLFYP